MKTLKLAMSVVAAGVMAASVASAHDRHHDDKVTLAVFGDWPYNQLLLDNSKLLTDSVNADKAVQYVVHLGDTHSGSHPCTSYGIYPLLNTNADPQWQLEVYNRFNQFNAPMIYTPGDNEWTDCHRAKAKGAGNPLLELEGIRTLFFAKLGYTLGRHDIRVWSQGKFYSPKYPTDATYRENLMWQREGIVFATMNVVGSNNGAVAWDAPFNTPENNAAQAEELANRTAAAIHWMEAAFHEAWEHHAKVIVLGIQADMWDPEAVDGNQYDKFQPIVDKLAELSLKFKGKVLLLNGDSHKYFEDQPLADPSSSTGKVYNEPAVPNLTRITVQGSTNAPAEWLRLTIDPDNYQDPFSWTNVQYCNDPETSCQ